MRSILCRLGSAKRRLRGSSIMQTTVAIGALAVLAGASAPTVQRYVDHARVIRTQKEVQVIGTALTMFAQDIGLQGVPKRPGSDESLRLLVSGGRIPETGKGMDRAWVLPSNHEDVGRLVDYLVENTPGFAETKFRGAGWAGPYLSKAINSDPWGNRYTCTVEWLGHPDLVPVVVSAGPDGQLTLPYRFGIKDASRSWGDDVLMALQ